MQRDRVLYMNKQEIIAIVVISRGYRVVFEKLMESFHADLK